MTFDNFKILFQDQFVILYLKHMNVASIDAGGDNISISAMIEGKIVDIDADYIYLGPSKNKINRAVFLSFLPSVNKPTIIRKILKYSNVGLNM